MLDNLVWLYLEGGIITLSNYVINLQRINIKTKLYPYDGPDTVTGYPGNGGAHEFYFNITIESPQEAVDGPKLPEKFSSFNEVAQYIRGFLQAHKYSVED